MEVENGKITLVLETGLDGGSVAIFQENKLLEAVEGENAVSKSEDLLQLLEILLNKNDLNRNDIKSIIVVKEPGSATGIRIGLATAKGLGNSLRVPVSQVSFLATLALQSEIEGVLSVAAYSKKGNTVYFQRFLINENREAVNLCELQNFNPESFREKLNMDGNKLVLTEVACRELNKLSALKTFDARMQVLDKSPAVIVGNAFASDNVPTNNPYLTSEFEI